MHLYIALFDSISNADTAILILGSMPGDTSINLQQYYGHPMNRFWKIISTITNNKLPITYKGKIDLLLKIKVGVWDVAHKADRIGSLDSAIKNEAPNYLEGFIVKHKNLKVIGFNGKKSESMFNKYFDRRDDIRYISLPSSSPANTTISFDDICKLWEQLFK